MGQGDGSRRIVGDYGATGRARHPFGDDGVPAGVDAVDSDRTYPYRGQRVPECCQMGGDVDPYRESADNDRRSSGFRERCDYARTSRFRTC